MKQENTAPNARVNKFRKLAKQIIEHHLSVVPTRLTFHRTGLTNFVFTAELKEGDLIVRISPEPAQLNTFIKEQWVQEQAAKAGVPVGRILETGASAVPFPYMISEVVRGTPAPEHFNRLSILRELGSYATVINSIKTKGFGEIFDWSKNKLSFHKTFGEYLKNEYAYEARLELLARHRICSGANLRVLRRLMREMAALRVTPRLNHGDLRLKNVYVNDNGKILGILDWEKTVSHLAPQWELSVALHDLNIDESQSFLEGYGLSVRRFARIADQTKAFNLLNYCSKIERSVQRKDKLWLARIRQRFSGVFDLYSLGHR